MRLIYLSIFCLATSLISCKSHENILCTHNSTEALARFSATNFTNVFCTNMILSNATKLKLEGQRKPLHERTFIQFLNITGNFTTNTLVHLPFVNNMLIYRSKIGIFDAHLKHFVHLHVAESIFPNITNDMFHQGEYVISTIGFHSNPGLQFAETSFQNFSLLMNLIIYNQSLPKVSDSFLKGQGSLKYLVLNKNGLKDIDENAFRDVIEIRNINLDDNPIELFIADIRHLHKLERLSLIHTNVKKFHVTEFFPLRKMRTLGIPYPAARDIGVQGLAIAFPNLRCLIVDSQSIEKDSLILSLGRLRIAGLNIDIEENPSNTSIFAGQLKYTFPSQKLKDPSEVSNCDE